MIIEFLLPNALYLQYTEEAATSLIGQDMPLSAGKSTFGTGRVLAAKLNENGIVITLDIDAAIPESLEAALSGEVSRISVDPEILGR